MALTHHRDLGYRLPARGARARLALVGQAASFGAAGVEEGHATLRPRFFEFGPGGDAGALRAALDAFAPHAVIAFQPEAIPSGLFAGVPAATVAYLEAAAPRDRRHVRAVRARRLGELGRIDAANFDRVVAFDPLIEPLAAEAGLALWRAAPLPVADRVYAPVRRLHGRPRILVRGRTTADRQALLDRLAERCEVSFGGEPDRAHHVALNLHDEPHPSFEHGVVVCLAAGLLVVTEPLEPRHGLEPGLDYLEAESPWALLSFVQQLADYPRSYESITVRGRRKAEAFRASRVYPRLLGDLWADLAALGTGRR